MRKDNRKVLSPSDVIRGSRLNNKAIMFDVDSRVKPENVVIKRVPENDNTFVKGCHGWKWRGGAAVVTMSFCLAVGLGASEALAQCAVPPTCDSLGYNKTIEDCANTEILKCPFDTSKIFCNPVYISEVTVGAIYYSDGTMSNSIISTKTPIGIIAYVNGKSGFAIALEESSFSSRGSSNTSCLKELDKKEAAADMNGKSNTACIMSEKGSENNFPAAAYCSSYKPVSSGKGSTGWYLPAAGELLAMEESYKDINKSLEKLSKTQISSILYLSSSVCSLYREPWRVNPYLGNLYWDNYSAGPFSARCVLAF